MVVEELNIKDTKYNTRHCYSNLFRLGFHLFFVNVVFINFWDRANGKKQKQKKAINSTKCWFKDKWTKRQNGHFATQVDTTQNGITVN